MDIVVLIVFDTVEIPVLALVKVVPMAVHAVLKPVCRLVIVLPML